MKMQKNFMLASFALLFCLPVHSAQAEEAAVQALTPAPLVEEKPFPATTEPAMASEQTTATQAARDNHTDYRYCLDFKTNKEIIECRYKK